MKCYYRQDFVLKHVNHEGTVNDFQHTYTIQDAIFSVAYEWNLVKPETLCQLWRKLWPAVMMAEGASDKQDSRI